MVLATSSAQRSAMSAMAAAWCTRTCRERSCPRTRGGRRGDAVGGYGVKGKVKFEETSGYCHQDSEKSCDMGSTACRTIKETVHLTQAGLLESKDNSFVESKDKSFVDAAKGEASAFKQPEPSARNQPAESQPAVPALAPNLPASMPSGPHPPRPLTRVDWLDDRLWGLLRSGEPCVITGSPLVAPLVSRWDFDYLARECGDFDGLNVHCIPRQKDVFARHYGAGLGVGAVRPMSFRNFVASVRAAAASERPDWRFYLQAPLLWQEEAAPRVSGRANAPSKASENGRQARSSNEVELESSSAAATMFAYPPGLRQAPVSAAMRADIESLGWRWLHRACEAASALPFDTCQLWAGSGGVTPCHYDARHNFLAQVRGRKKVLLVCPSESFLLYPYPVGHPMDNFAMVDLEAPDLRRFPAARNVSLKETVLAPGEVLWLPRYYWHHVRQLDTESSAENISLNFWAGDRGFEAFAQRMRDAPLGPTRQQSAVPSVTPVAAEVQQSAQCPLRHVSSNMHQQHSSERSLEDVLPPPGYEEAQTWLHAARVTEASAQRLLGDEAGRFLNSLAADTSWRMGTPEHTLACRIRLELAAVLGGAAHASRLLRAITLDGRLYPGLAPPVVGPVFSSDGEAGAKHTPIDEMQRILREEQQGGT